MGLLTLWTLIAILPGVGTTAFDFLRVSPTAREVAMGSFNPAAGAGAFAFYYNPAQILYLSAPQGQFSYINYPAGINAGSAAYSQLLSDKQGVGVGVYYLNSGTMKRTNEQGDELGTFGVSYADLNLAGALRLANPLVLGLGISGVYGNIDTFFSIGITANLGAVYHLFAYNLRLGISANNLGVQIKPFGDYRDPMPADFTLGISWQPLPSLNLGFALNKPIDDRLRLGLGVEGELNQYLILRGGYNSSGTDWGDNSANGLLSGFAAGLGVRYNRYQIDYTFAPMGVLGFSHRLSFGFSL